MTTKLAEDDAEFRRFVYLLGAERVVGTPGRNHLDELLTESKKIGRELTASGLSNLSFRVAHTVDFMEPLLQHGGFDEQEVYRAAHRRGTGDLRSDDQEGDR